jgi:hypothetical protein
VVTQGIAVTLSIRAVFDRSAVVEKGHSTTAETFLTTTCFYRQPNSGGTFLGFECSPVPASSIRSALAGRDKTERHN